MTGPKVYISYSHSDAEWVRQFAEALRNLDVVVWLDVWQIRAGDFVRDVRDEIEAGLRDSDAVIAVLSEANVGRPNTLFELGAALGMGKRVIPIVAPDLEGSAIPLNLRWWHYLRQESPDETAREVAAALKGDQESKGQSVA